MNAHALTSLLAPTDEVELAMRTNEDFKGFLALALKSSGEPTYQVDLKPARFRVLDARFGQRDDLRLEDTVACWGQAVTISELVEPSVGIDRSRLVHSLWRLESFDEVKVWLKSLRAVLRLAYNLDNKLRGHLLLAETIIPMVETVERKEYVLANGDMASDAITRNLAIRAKVFSLDRHRRSPRGPNSNSIMERLSRTLSKVNQ